MHEVLYHMGQFISRDSDVTKRIISKTPQIPKNATIGDLGRHWLQQMDSGYGCGKWDGCH